VNEDEWLASIHPGLMLPFLWDRVQPSDRKLRLFACACCRRIWHLLTDERSQRAVRVAELFADTLATAEELKTAEEDAWAVWEADLERESPGRGMLDGLGDSYPFSAAAYNAAIQPRWWGAAPAFVAPYQIILDGSSLAEGADQCVLVRDIFGNPFRPVTINPAWLTPTVESLAQAAYDERLLPAGELDRDRLAILADALEDAGCDDDTILNHLRQPGSHVRGCWALDLLLGKE
jgi:hypothetical protein